MAAFADLPRGALSISLQKLTGRGLVKITDIRREKEQARRMDISFSEAAKPVLADLETARQDYASARLASLLPEELEQHNQLTEKIHTHIREILQQKTTVESPDL